MPDVPTPFECPDCGDPLTYAFTDTSGVGAHKRGDSFNTVPDTRHYLCFLCAKAWKQRLAGPLTPDVVGDIAFFTCRQPGCGRPLSLIDEPTAPPVDLACEGGHRYRVEPVGNGELTLAESR